MAHRSKTSKNGKTLSRMVVLVPDDLIERADALAAKMTEQAPMSGNLRVTRSNVVREALEMFLNAKERA